MLRKRLLYILNIRNDEAWLVLNLFCLKSFQGFGVAIFNVVAFTLFLKLFLANSLPWAYMASAVLLWVSGYIYSKAEHALHVKKLALLVILMVAASMVIFRLQFYFFSHSPTLVFFMVLWFYLLYLLDNLEFWGIAALLFDIRQSKRMFGLLGAVDMPAKLIGYATVPLLIEFIDIENLLFLSCAAVLVSLVFYFRLRNSGHLDIHVKHDEHEHDEKHAHFTQNVGAIIKSLFTNRMITLVAGLSFIVVCCVTLISFYFYAEVKHKAHSDQQLADFISIFYALGGGAAILIRLIITGRITEFLGTRNSLLVSPLVLFLMLTGIMLIPLFTDNEFFILYAYGSMAILAEVLKTSLQDPTLFSLMQTLSFNMRLRGHTIVKGVMDPFAMAFSGLVLLGLLGLAGGEPEHMRYSLYVALVIFLVLWVVMIFVVDREYVRTLVLALHKRYAVGNEIDLADEKTNRVLEERINEGSVGDAIYVLNLVERKYSTDKEPLVLKALQHSKPEVRIEAIRLAERKKIQNALPFIDDMISSRSNPEILPETVKTKCVLLPDELDEIEEFLNDADLRLAKAAIAGSISSGGISAMVIAGQKLLAFISSPVAEERKIAAQIIGELGIHSFYKPVLTLLKDEDREVAKAAITAAGKLKNEKLVEPLLALLVQGIDVRLVLSALKTAGNVALPGINNVIHSRHVSRAQQHRLIQVCGNIGTPEAAALLDEWMDELPTLHSHILISLHLCKFRVTQQSKAKYENFIHFYFDAAIRVLFMIECAEKAPDTKILTEALYIEFYHLRDSLLLLFSFIYDEEKMIKARNAFQFERKENIANGLELVEIALPKDYAYKFIKLYEPAEVQVKTKVLHSFFNVNLDFSAMMEEILNNKHCYYHRWTRAAALYAATFYAGNEKRKWFENASNEPDALLAEIGERALSETGLYEKSTS